MKKSKGNVRNANAKYYFTQLMPCSRIEIF